MPTLGTAKTAKPPFYSFCSTQDARFQKSHPVNDEPARHAKWLIRYPDGRAIETWIDPPVSREEVLASRLDAIDATPIEVERTPEPASCARCQHRPPRNPPGSPAPCGAPAAAGLAERDGVIRYHPRGGAGCPAYLPRGVPELERRIRRMAERWGYSDDELAEVLRRAARDPGVWLAVLEADEALNERRGAPWSLKSD